MTNKELPLFSQSLLEQVQEDIITCDEGFDPEVFHNADDINPMVSVLCDLVLNRLGGEPDFPASLPNRTCDCRFFSISHNN